MDTRKLTRRCVDWYRANPGARAVWLPPPWYTCDNRPTLVLVDGNGRELARAKGWPNDAWEACLAAVGA